MSTVIVADQLQAKLNGQWYDMWTRIRAGSLDAARASQGMQLVQEDRWDKQVDVPYANERVPSTLGYPESFMWHTAKEQEEFWRSQKPTRKLDASHITDLAKRIYDQCLPPGMETIGVWPKYSRLGGLYTATGTIFGLIAKARSFKNWRGDEILSPGYWRHTIKTAGCLERLDRYQPGDYFVVPIQGGKLWVGASIRHARSRYAEAEFGLCPYSGVCILAANPNRITGDGQLYMDMAGCEWAPYAGGDFYSSAYFGWYVGQLNFDCRYVGHASVSCGSASGFLPQ